MMHTSYATMLRLMTQIHFFSRPMCISNRTHYIKQIDENTKWFYFEVHRNFKISNYWQINSVNYNPQHATFSFSFKLTFIVMIPFTNMYIFTLVYTTLDICSYISPYSMSYSNKKKLYDQSWGFRFQCESEIFVLIQFPRL